VATRVGGLPGLVEDQGTGLLVPPDDVPALAQAIVRLLETPGLAATMGARGRTRALAEFSLDRMSERVDTFYSRVLWPGEDIPAPREAVQGT
jgi:starch synthase